MRKFAVLLVLTFAAVPLFANEYVQTSLGQALRLVGTASAPKVVRRVNPSFPLTARQLKMDGPVKLAVLVDASGKVAEITVAEGKWVPLNAAAVAAVRGWEFRPAVVDGQPVPALIDVQIIFSLR
jgi:protein TonB